MSEPKTKLNLIHKLVVPAIASLCGLVSCEIESITNDSDAKNSDINWKKLSECCKACVITGYECEPIGDSCACVYEMGCNIQPYLCNPNETCKKTDNKLPFEPSYQCVPNFNHI